MIRLFSSSILRRKYSGGFTFHCRYGACGGTPPACRALCTLWSSGCYSWWGIKGVKRHMARPRARAPGSGGRAPGWWVRRRTYTWRNLAMVGWYGISIQQTVRLGGCTWLCINSVDIIGDNGRWLQTTSFHTLKHCITTSTQFNIHIFIMLA